MHEHIQLAELLIQERTQHRAEPRRTCTAAS